MKSSSFATHSGGRTVWLVGCLLLLLLSGCHHGQEAASDSAEPAAVASSHNSHATDAAPTEIAQKIPHYFDDPDEAKPFPKTLDPDTMKSAAAKQAYAAARRIPEVLAQQPCYCFCDKGFGHGSLLHCHIDNHSAD